MNTRTKRIIIKNSDICEIFNLILCTCGVPDDDVIYSTRMQYQCACATGVNEIGNVFTFGATVAAPDAGLLCRCCSRVHNAHAELIKGRTYKRSEGDHHSSAYARKHARVVIADTMMISLLRSERFGVRKAGASCARVFFSRQAGRTTPNRHNTHTHKHHNALLLQHSVLVCGRPIELFVCVVSVVLHVARVRFHVEEQVHTEDINDVGLGGRLANKPSSFKEWPTNATILYTLCIYYIYVPLLTHNNILAGALSDNDDDDVDSDEGVEPLTGRSTAAAPAATQPFRRSLL